MARLPALATALADACGQDVAATNHIARMLREAELVSRTKRGLGASTMTVADAAAMLLGVAAPVLPRQVPDAVRQFSSLVLRFPDRSETSFLPPEVLGALTFGEAIEALIAHAGTIADEWDELSEGYLGERQWKAMREMMPAGTAASQMQLEVEMLDTPAANVSFRVLDNHSVPHTLHNLEYIVNADLLMSGGYTLKSSLHMLHVTRFDMAPFLALHRTLMEPNADGGVIQGPSDPRGPKHPLGQESSSATYCDRISIPQIVLHTRSIAPEPGPHPGPCLV